MKTVVRLLIVAGIVFTAVFLASSCKDDDKDDQTDIIGTWQLAESVADVELTATATETEKNVEAAISNYVKVPITSKVIFNATQVSFSYSINEAEIKTVTYPYTLNDGTLSIVLPIDDPKAILGNVDLKDNTLKITLTKSSYLSLLQHFAAQDNEFKDIVDQIASADIYYRLNRVK